VWFIRTAGISGDNFMVFDNYRFVAYAPPSARPPTLTILGLTEDRQLYWWLTGESNRQYVVEATRNLDRWRPVSTNRTSANGLFDFVDTETPPVPNRIYRTRLVP
jgi:hypothetical protein